MEIQYNSIIAQEIKSLTEQGICLIPVGEKDKAAREKWGHIERPLSLVSIFDLMAKHETNAVALICGKVSGNLFAIDFDVKNKLEWKDGDFLKLFIDVFGEILDEVRIEKSPSGGNHIFYKVTGVPEGVEFKFDKKIANRLSSSDELLLNPKEKTKCFIEIKGNGNICQCYPSPGYTLISGDIGTINWSQHLEVLSFLKSFDEVIKEPEFKIKPSKNENSWYIEGENPFEHFNRNDSGCLLENAGWNKGSVGNKYISFSRPGVKSYHVGASFDKVNKMYNIFTTSGGLDPRSYNPSDLLCLLEYGGNKSELKEWLVSQGYGKLKRNVESGLIKRAVKYGILLPANISKEGKDKIEEEKNKLKEKYQHGLFWNIEEGSKGEIIVEISQKKLDSIVIALGFRNLNGEGLVLLDGWKVKKIDESRVFHALINYILRVEGFEEVDEIDGIIESIAEEDRLEVEKIYNAYSAHINKYGKLTIEHLKEFGKILDGRVLVSSKTESYKFYKNCYVSVVADGCEICQYEKLGDKLVLEHLIIGRDFKHTTDLKDSAPYQFFSKAIGIDTSFLTILGYLAHDFIDDSMNAIFVGLGSPGCGKNVMFNLLNHISPVHIIDGRQIELDKNLLQSYGGQRILVISDVEANFKYDFFKNFSSGAASLKKLYKDVVVLKRKNMPKPVILTNFSYKMVEGLERRIVDVEFMDFFSKIKGGVATHFGMMFPGYDLEDKGGWSEYDWNCFDNICLNAICAFLKVGEIKPKELTENSWYKRFDQTYGYLREFFAEKFDDLVGLGKIKCIEFDNLYNQWTTHHKIKLVFSSTKYNKALTEYCEYLGYEFRKDAVLKDDHGFDAKYKVFKKKGQKEIEESGGLPF